jgi:hypothetical protein
LPDGFFVYRLLVRCQKARIMNEEVKLSVRGQRGNQNHHLWNNNGTWWCHFTVHLPEFRKERLRFSLETPDQEKACQLRDAVLALFGVQPGERTM